MIKLEEEEGKNVTQSTAKKCRLEREKEESWFIIFLGFGKCVIFTFDFYFIGRRVGMRGTK